VSGFVVCPACGTRIKAGRGHCLRCFEPLPLPDEPDRPAIWRSLGLSPQQSVIGGLLASLVVLTLIVVIWRTWPEPADDVATPIASPTTRSPQRAAAPVSSTPVRTEPIPSPEPSAADARPPEPTASERADLETKQVALEQALAKTPNDPQALDGLGQVLIRLNRFEDAIAQFERAIAQDPGRVAYRLDLARAAIIIGGRSRAIEEYREVARLLPQDPAIRYTLGIALQQNGDHGAALPEFQRAIALAPADPRAHLAYAVSLDQLQRSADAAEQYRVYVQMRPTAPDVDEVKARIQTLQSSVQQP
jgi:tetratricopeptide (TPR) repeat protein